MRCTASSSSGAAMSARVPGRRWISRPGGRTRSASGTCRSDIDEARELGDPGRAERAEDELDALVQQLSEAFGLVRSGPDHRDRRRSGPARR